MKRFFKRGVVIASALAIATAMAATAVAATTNTSSTVAEDTMKNNKMGKVTAIEDSTVTIEIGGMGEKPADGETPPAKPDGESSTDESNTPPETPADGETPPAKPDGDDAEHQAAETITVAQSLIDGDIEVGSMVDINYDSEGNISSVTLAPQPEDLAESSSAS